MEQCTTYTVKSKQDGFVWVFKYRLNGSLKSFEILDAQLSPKQSQWLFSKGNFPVTEDIMKQVWAKNLRANFEIGIGFPDISFESFWDSYGLKTRKEDTKKLWAKLPDSERLKALDGIRRYNNHLRLFSWKSKVDPNRYLKGKRWEDEF